MKDNIMNSRVLIIIPARLNSSRFPRKILTPINNRPLIINTLENAMKSGITKECYIACCSKEVKDIVEDYGYNAIITDPELQSGTDRIFEASKSIDRHLNDDDIIINLQGDMPVFDESILHKIVDILEKDRSIDMSTPVSIIKDISKINDKNCVKVVFNNMEKNIPGKALYFSRESIPSGSDIFYKHIGIYAYRYHALKRFVSLERSYLEETEKLEQLRALQNNINIFAVPVESYSFSVDVREDLNQIFEFLSSNKL